MREKKIKLAFFFISILFSVSCSDVNRYQFKLRYENSATLTVTCHNCFYYSGHYGASQMTVVQRKIDEEAIGLFSRIKFCGIGDTTPDGSIKIETDTGDIAEFGVLFPNQEFNPTLRIQSNKTGLGQGCTRKNQERFEAFFFTYAKNSNLRE